MRRSSGKKQSFGQRPRRQVEIYFVLYLAALLLLLPNKREKAQDAEPSLVYEILRSRFIIAPERSTLNCQLLAVGDSVRIIALDSVNVVSSSGDVAEVHYEFIIEDETQGQTLAISTNSPNVGVFTMREDAQRRLAEFSWRPAVNEKRSRVLNVTVVATAKPVVPPNITRPEIRAQLERLLDEQNRWDTARAEFAINISFVNAGRAIALSDIDIDSLINAVRAETVASAATSATSPAFSPPVFVTSRSFVPPPPGEFSLYAAAERVECLPFQQWENSIRVYGMNLRQESRGDPRAEILRTDRNDGTGTVSIAEVRNDFIRLTGVAPASGLMTIRVAVTRSGDGKQGTVDFPVRVNPLGAPEFPRKMYAGVNYEFDPKLPFITGQELRATLSLGGKERSIGLQGAKFTFVPEESDIGKTFTFERFIGGRRVGEAYYIKVEEFSSPEILEVFSQGADEFVRTRCYGVTGNTDNRVTLEAKGNLKVSERFGDRRTEPPATTQLFKVSKAEPDKPFSGSIRAIDAKGRASLVRFIDRKD
jgi:hypothetical protein